MVWSVVLLTQKENQIFPRVKSKKSIKSKKPPPFLRTAFDHAMNANES